MSWPEFFYPHRVRVRDFLGAGGMGPRWSPPPGRELAAEVKDEIRLVRNKDGAEVVSSSQVSVGLAANVPIESLVTVWAGTAAQREASVIAVSRDDNTDSPLDSFLVLHLT